MNVCPVPDRKLRAGAELVTARGRGLFVWRCLCVAAAPLPWRRGGSALGRPPIELTGGPGSGGQLQASARGFPPKEHAGAVAILPAGRSTRRAAHAQWSRAIPSAASRPAGPQGGPPRDTDSGGTAEGTLRSGRGEGGWGGGGGCWKPSPRRRGRPPPDRGEGAGPGG